MSQAPFCVLLAFSFLDQLHAEEKQSTSEDILWPSLSVHPLLCIWPSPRRGLGLGPFSDIQAVPCHSHISLDFFTSSIVKSFLLRPSGNSLLHHTFNQDIPLGLTKLQINFFLTLGLRSPFSENICFRKLIQIVLDLQWSHLWFFSALQWGKSNTHSVEIA